MKNLVHVSILFVLAAIFSFAFQIKPAAADTVIFNGIEYTCTNTCVITCTTATCAIEDCCGGRIHAIVR